MAKGYDLIGQKFGKLTVVEKTGDRTKDGQIIWKCVCDCSESNNSIIYAYTNELLSGRKKSCGCELKHKYEDLTGQTFGRLTVLNIAGRDDKRRTIIWRCICSCDEHNEVYVSSEKLKSGNTSSCGCLSKEILINNNKSRVYDLTGKRFGMLEVERRIRQDENCEPTWLCLCDCGRRIEVSSNYLLGRKKISCGCIQGSYGEKKIKEILNNNNILYTTNKHFTDCKFPDTGYYGYFDFFVKSQYVIEFDGRQHFKPEPFLAADKNEAEQNFKKLRFNDLYKTVFCLKNNIPIIRIPYKNRDILNLEDLKLETTKFLIKDESDMMNYFEIPKFCPCCGEKTVIKFTNSSEVLYCTNDYCAGKTLGLWTAFVSKKAMDIDGLSEQTLKVLLNRGYLTNMFCSVYELHQYKKELYKLDGFGKKSIDNLLTAIENSKNVDLIHFITAFSIPGVGTGQSKLIAAKYHTFDEFMKACDNQDDFTTIPGIGKVLDSNIKNWWVNNHMQMMDVAAFCSFKDDTKDFMNAPTGNFPLAGLTFVVTGKVNTFANRTELQNKIEELGGKVSGSVSKNTNYLINNDVTSMSGKNKKAKDLGVEIISEEQFLQMCKNN